jgi:hypothetical protein
MATYNADLNVSGTLTVPSGVFSDSVTVSGAPVLTSDSVVGGGGSALTVKEIDGIPTVSNVDTIRVSNGTLVDDGGGQVTITVSGEIGTATTSGSYWLADAPPVDPSPFDDEFDSFGQEANQPAAEAIDPAVWTEWDPGATVNTRNKFGEGIGPDGFAFSTGGVANVWGGWVQDLAPMVATISGGGSWWVDTKVKIGERESKEMWSGIAIGGDLIGSPTTEEILYIALVNNSTSPSALNDSQGYVSTVSNGVVYNSAITLNAQPTDASGPMPTDMYLRIGYAGPSDEFYGMYSTDGSTWSILTNDGNLLASGTLNFEPKYIGLVGRSEDAGGALHRFQYFRFRTNQDRNAGASRITISRLPLLGRRVFADQGGGSGGGSGDGNITDINAQEGPSVTITGIGAISSTTAGNVITLSADEVFVGDLPDAGYVVDPRAKSEVVHPQSDWFDAGVTSSGNHRIDLNKWTYFDPGGAGGNNPGDFGGYTSNIIQGDGTARDSAMMQVNHSGTNVGSGWVGFFQPVPTDGNGWTITTRVGDRGNFGAIDDLQIGLFCGEDLAGAPSTTDMRSIHLNIPDLSTSETDFSRIQSQIWTDYNTPSTVISTQGDGAFEPGTEAWLRMSWRESDDRIECDFSTDGRNWRLLEIYLPNSFTPGHFGFGIRNNSIWNTVPTFEFFAVTPDFGRSGMHGHGRLLPTVVSGTVPNHITIASGTFGDSLTISGVPVSLGGGGSASTLQEAYDNGDGIITTTAGKPLHISGDEYDGNVDFQVTGSGKFTEALQVGSGTTFVDTDGVRAGDGVFGETLTVQGLPVLTSADLPTLSGAGYSVWVSDAPPDPNNMPNNLALLFSDEFDSDTLSPSWTVWDEGGNTSVVASGSYGPGLRMSQETVAGNSFGGIYTAVPSSDSWEIVTKVHLSGREVDDNKAGIFIAEDLDANPTTANILAFEVVYGNGGITVQLTEYTAYDGTTTGETIVWDLGSTNRVDHTHFYLKLVRRVSGNDITIPLLSTDGVSWIFMDKSSAGYNGSSVPTPFTPVHMGAFINNDDSGAPSDAVFSFFRVNEYGPPPTSPTGRRLQLGNTNTLGPDSTPLDSFSGAAIKINAAQTTTTAGNYIVQWDELVRDTDGYVNLAGDNTLFTIPANAGITHVKLVAQVVWSNFSGVGRRAATIRKNGNTVADGLLHRTDHAPGSTDQLTQQSETTTISAQPGDTFSLQLYQDSGGDLDIIDATADSSTWFSIERANSVAVSGTEFTSVSGTFEQSLTVSGVPVNIGAGGGAGTITSINTDATGPAVTITGVGGINTITEGNVITVSGAGNFSPGFRGVYLTSTSGSLVLDDASVELPWDTAAYDTDGFHESPDGSKIIIPAGINKVRFTFGTSFEWQSVPAGDRSMFIVDKTNSVTIAGERKQATQTQFAGTMGSITSPIVDVVEGQTFVATARLNEAGESLEVYSGDPSFFACEVIDPAPVPGFVGKQGFKGALIQRTTGQTFTTGTNIPVEWQTTEYDIGGWFNIGEDDTYFTVPEGVTKVRATCQVIWGANTTGIRVTQIQIDTGGGFATFVGQGFRRLNALTDGSVSRVDICETASVTVAAGDKIRILGSHTRGTDLDINGGPQTWFAVEAVETNENFQIDEFTAASGTFTQSLTVSGVPVSTGTGGGGAGTISDINTVATGPSVTITGAAGINTITEGNVITISGAGNFSPGFQGARLATTSGIETVNNVSVNHPWDTVVYDTNGFTNSGDVNTFIIPAGIKKIVLKTSISWPTNAVGFRRIQFRRDGLLLHATTSFPVPDTSTATTITSPIIDVVEGEEFNVLIGQGSGGNLTTNPGLPDTRYFFELEVIDPAPVPGLVGKKALNGALIKKTADQTGIITATETDVTWEQTVYDTNGWVDLANNRFIVPPGVTKVHVGYNILWEDAFGSAGARTVNTKINGATQPGTGFNARDADNDNGTPTNGHYSAAMEVAPGDLITLTASQTQGSDGEIRNANSTWFYIEAAETNESFQIDEFTAVSGTFNESLTISGVPINTNFSPGFRGAYVTTTSGVTYTDAIAQLMPFDDVIYDTDGFFGPNPTLFTIPAGVKKIRMSAGFQWAANATGARLISIRSIDPGPQRIAAAQFESPNETAARQHQQSATTPVIDVVEGETYGILGLQQSTGNLDIEAATATFMSIEVVDPGAGTANHVNTISGSFTQSLTVSGVPVSLGGGSGVTKYQQMFTDQTSVSITHNIGSIVHMTTILDTNDYVIDATLQYGENTDTVTFSETQSGSAIVMG